MPERKNFMRVLHGSAGVSSFHALPVAWLGLPTADLLQSPFTDASELTSGRTQ